MLLSEMCIFFKEKQISPHTNLIQHSAGDGNAFEITATKCVPFRAEGQCGSSYFVVVVAVCVVNKRMQSKVARVRLFISCNCSM